VIVEIEFDSPFFRSSKEGLKICRYESDEDTGMYEAIGNPEEGYLILPDLKKVKRAHLI